MFDSLLSLLRQKVSPARSSRTSKRMLMSIPGRLRLPGSDDRAWASVFLENVSTGGACVHSHLHLGVGERVELLISLGHDRKYRLNAKIVHSELEADGFQSSYGVRFLAPADDVLAGITDYIRNQERTRRSGVGVFSTQAPPA